MMKTLARADDTAEILRRLSALGPDSTRQWGLMSVSQAVCHLIDANRMALGEKAVSDATSFASRTLIKAMALYLPVTWPRSTPTIPEIKADHGGTRPTAFAADVLTLATLVETLAARRGRDDWPPHPIFGRMSERAWLRWGYLHMDHHLRQFGA
jgi:hypothetical protein